MESSSNTYHCSKVFDSISFRYDENRNVFNGRTNTMSVTDSIFCKQHVNMKNNFLNLTIDFSNFYLELDEFHVRINWLYLAKDLSKPKYSTSDIQNIVSKPKTALFVILLLFMCGDTGASINPGPRTDCSYCDKEIIYNNTCLTCQNCYLKVHLKCNHFYKSSNFLCNICTSNLLPSPLHEINTMTDYNRNATNNNMKSVYEDQNMYEHFKNKGLHFIHVNARSLYNKMSEIRHISGKTNAAVIAITETWFNDSHTDTEVGIIGYNILRRDRQGHAGGVCVYIREGITYNCRTDLFNDDLEDLWLEILLTKSKPIYVGVCYRNEKNKDLIKCLENTLSKLRPDHDLLVLGDFNICFLKNKTKLGKDYKALLNFFNCKQLIKSPTRVTETTSSLLDHIFTNNVNKICYSGVLLTGLSDHFITYCTRKTI